jgi:hypothetical protein
MTRSNLAKLGLAALLLAATALPARAGLVTVNEFDGTNLNYTATVTTIAGVTFIDIDFTTDNSNNLITRVNHAAISPKLFSMWTGVGGVGDFVETIQTPVTPNGAGGVDFGLQVGSLGTVGGNIGVQDTTGAVLNDQFGSGSTTGAALTEGVTLSGTIRIDTVNFPGNPTSYTQGSTTYDFSPFADPNQTSFIVTLNSADDLLGAFTSGNGTFAGTASFTAVATVVPEPSSALLLCMGGLVAGVARRRRK